MGLGSHNINVKSLFTVREKLAIQYVSLSFASLSLVACLVALYWFSIMGRNFRRTLVLMLLISDMFKSLWYVIFPAVSIIAGGIESGSRFCNAGGYLLQVGIESCDMAILFMSLHMSLQIFNSTSGRLGPDGLYRIRYAVFALWIIVPAFMASLAFVNRGGAFLSQGAFCTLPIRPFWYRLALSWIPRYLIWLYITITALRIYLRVGNGFTVFARKIDSGSNPSDYSRPSTRDNLRRVMVTKKRPARLTVPVETNTPLPTDGSVLSHTPSTGYFDVELGKTSPTSDTTRGYSRDTLQHPVRSESTRPETQLVSELASRTEHESDGHPTNEMANGGALVQITSNPDATQQSRRRAIQRQTRLLFIYPCVYMILMVIPFIQHCFNYSDYYAQHPIFIISLLGPTCFSVMGFADCCIFCWRETPWRNIPGADGTFLGSFKFWQFMGSHATTTAPIAASGEFRRAMRQLQQQSLGDSRQVSTASAMAPGMSLYSFSQDNRPGSSGSGTKKFLQTFKVVRPSARRVFSGASDRATLAAEYAAERLALERAAAAAAQSQQFRGCSLSERDEGDTATKEWFDRRQSLFDDLEDVADGEDNDSSKRKMSAVSSHAAVSPTKVRDLERERERMRRDFGAM
ncbi:hypothetical protein ANO11243_082150 [Dothideomycetidae sp. 11243]|nr:hypothetical protein ANO11243_082150 [fungal sp. No.11243]